MKKIFAGVLPIVFFFTMISNALGVEYQSARTLALGGAGRAGPFLTDAIYLNPSFASYTPIYTLSGGYNSFQSGRNYNFSVQDSRSEFLQAGAGFTKREQNLAVNIGASKAFAKRYGVGVATKLILDNGTNHMTSDFLVSGSILATSWLYATLVVDNLVANTAQTSRNLDRTAFVALKLIAAHKIEFYLDPFYSPAYSHGNKAGYSVGIEIGMLEDLYLRMGKYQDAEVTHLNTRGNGFGMGLGWIGPKLNLEYAMNRTLSSHAGNSMTTSHSTGATIYF
jgi:hypothetical protein